MENKGPRILLIDDEDSMQDVLSVTQQPAGYHLFPVRTGKAALQMFQSARPEMILLDLFLPDMDGKDVLRRLREQTTSPIIVMSVRHAESEKIACFDAGADDYLTKPFTMGELLARLRAALRRAFGAQRNEIFAAGDLRVDFSRRANKFNGDRIRSLKGSRPPRWTGENAPPTDSRNLGNYTVSGCGTPVARHRK